MPSQYNFQITTNNMDQTHYDNEYDIFYYMDHPTEYIEKFIKPNIEHIEFTYKDCDPIIIL